MLFKFFILATIVALVCAKPQGTETNPLPPAPSGAPLGRDYFWDVTNWKAGCDPSSWTNYNQCFYSFNLEGKAKNGTGPRPIHIPAFNATCSVITVSVGSNVQMPCDITDNAVLPSKITAMMLPTRAWSDPDKTMQLYISWEFADWGAGDMAPTVWNYTSLTDGIIHGPKTFTVITTSAFIVS